MPSLSHLDWPFFDESHRRFAPALAHWSAEALAPHISHTDIDRTCRLDQGSRNQPDHARIIDGKDVRHRNRAARNRPCGADLRRQCVRVGVKVEALYREIRALRIYEGATEVQKIIIAREILKAREFGKRQAAE